MATLHPESSRALDGGEQQQRGEDTSFISLDNGVTQQGRCPSSVLGRVLVVDADTGCKMIIADILQDAGFSALPCPSVTVAPGIMHQTQPDALIVDPRISPGVTAMHLINRIKTDPALRAIPIIICSADDALLDDHAVTWQRHRCQIVPKPFDVDALLDAVHAVVCSDDGASQSGHVTLA